MTTLQNSNNQTKQPRKYTRERNSTRDPSGSSHFLLLILPLKRLATLPPLPLPSPTPPPFPSLPLKITSRIPPKHRIPRPSTNKNREHDTPVEVHG